jgi:hypothetical protein
MWPEEEWQNQKVYGKEIKVADIDSALYNLQMKAMQMEPGTVPNNDYWEDVLGHEKPSKHAGHGDGKKAATLPNTARSPSQANETPLPTESERARPSRGRKRHYDDNSFVGYGEGYADDDDDTAFYSNSEGMGKKKRKKVRSHAIWDGSWTRLIVLVFKRSMFQRFRLRCPIEAVATVSVCLALERGNQTTLDRRQKSNFLFNVPLRA